MKRMLLVTLLLPVVVLVSTFNANSQIVSYDIFLYDGTTLTKLTKNTLFDESPQINDNGEVVWDGRFHLSGKR